jgi:hypothetical protein
LLTWKKQKVSILHSYHYKNVKEEDLPAYSRQMGIGQIVVGTGLCLAGILRLLTKSFLSWSALIAGLVLGFGILHKAQMKYNGSWFS